MHRVGGLEKADGTGNVSYDPANHGKMTDIRQKRIELIADDIPLTDVAGDPDSSTAIVGWGSTWGAIRGASRRLAEAGTPIAHIHLTHLNPLPKDLGEVLSRYEHVYVPELNMGQLVKILRAEFLIDAKPINKVMGQPFTAGELTHTITSMMTGTEA